jgi:TonB family protein
MKKAWFGSIFLHVCLCGALLGHSAKEAPQTPWSSNVEWIDLASGPGAIAKTVRTRKSALKTAVNEMDKSGEQQTEEPKPNDIATGSQSISNGVAEFVEFRPSPEYPSLALADGLEGEIIIEVKTDRFGNVAEIELIRGSGHSVLDAEALATVKSWRLQPLKKIRVPVSFHLNS